MGFEERLLYSKSDIPYKINLKQHLQAESTPTVYRLQAYDSIRRNKFFRAKTKLNVLKKILYPNKRSLRKTTVLVEGATSQSLEPHSASNYKKRRI